MRRAARAPHSIVVPASICAAQRILPIIVAISTNATQIGTFPSAGQAALSLMLPRQFSFGPQRAPFGCDAIDRPRRRAARLSDTASALRLVPNRLACRRGGLACFPVQMTQKALYSCRVVAFSDGKPVTTFPENAPAGDPQRSWLIPVRKGEGGSAAAAWPLAARAQQSGRPPQ
jgi:hypothetical protein